MNNDASPRLEFNAARHYYTSPGDEVMDFIGALIDQKSQPFMASNLLEITGNRARHRVLDVDLVFSQAGALPAFESTWIVQRNVVRREGEKKRLVFASKLSLDWELNDALYQFSGQPNVSSVDDAPLYAILDGMITRGIENEGKINLRNGHTGVWAQGPDNNG